MGGYEILALDRDPQRFEYLRASVWSHENSRRLSTTGTPAAVRPGFIARRRGDLDDTQHFWRLPARNRRSFAAELQRAADPLFRA